MSTKGKLSASATVCELVKLKSQQKYLESSQLPIHLNELSLDDIAKLTEINTLQEQLKNQLPAFKLNLMNEFEVISSTISAFKSIITNRDNLQLYHTKEYRDRIISIDQTFRTIFQKNMKELCRLKGEFCDLESTVVPANYLLNETIKICPSVASVSRSMKPIDRDDNVDIKKFDDFIVASNGHTGGWNDEEHFLFLKLKTKYKENIDQIVMSIKHITGDKTEEEIRKHNQWYIKYVELKDKKKAAIKNWKDSRIECNVRDQHADT